MILNKDELQKLIKDNRQSSRNTSIQPGAVILTKLTLAIFDPLFAAVAILAIKEAIGVSASCCPSFNSTIQQNTDGSPGKGRNRPPDAFHNSGGVCRDCP